MHFPKRFAHDAVIIICTKIWHLSAIALCHRIMAKSGHPIDINTPGLAAWLRRAVPKIHGDLTTSICIYILLDSETPY